MAPITGYPALADSGMFPSGETTECIAMASASDYDSWSAGQNYEHYMGRWSRRIAEAFLGRIATPENADWLEIGCGTGALTASILSACSPRSLVAVDQSADFAAYAAKGIADARVRFEVADVQDLPFFNASFDVVTSALVLNFVPDMNRALGEMQRVLRPGGLLAFYVWDYPGGGMGFIDAFWSAAAELDPKAAALDEGARFPFCTPEGLARLCREAGIAEPSVTPVEIETAFPDFDAFWHPFTLGAGPAPGYCRSLSEEGRERLKARLAEKVGATGPVSLPARAWAVCAERLG
jgi:SAM-dependent methyltransferase